MRTELALFWPCASWGWRATQLQPWLHKASHTQFFKCVWKGSMDLNHRPTPLERDTLPPRNKLQSLGRASCQLEIWKSSLVQQWQWPGWRDRWYPQQVCWWHKSGRSGWYTRRLCCHSVKPGQAGELGREEPDEVQQGQVQGPAPGEEQPHAPVQARDW